MEIPNHWKSIKELPPTTECWAYYQRWADKCAAEMVTGQVTPFEGGISYSLEELKSLTIQAELEDDQDKRLKAIELLRHW